MDVPLPGTGMPEIPPRPPQEAPQPPLPQAPFLSPFLRWLFLLSLPASLAFSLLAVYIHEFAHGLTALAGGGYFLGIQGARFNRHSPVFAYADAWSLDHEALVLIAGIGVNVLLGGLILWSAFRTRALVPRILLFILASEFLSEFHYALQGCLAPEGAQLDIAMFLKELPSATLRSACLILSLLGMVSSTCVVARGLFRCWEQVFGALSGRRAFWVILLLSNPSPLPIAGQGQAPLFLAISLLFVVGVPIWLLVTRTRTAVPLPVQSFGRWSLASFAGALMAIAGIFALRHGIRFGNYPSSAVRDIHPERRAVAGFTFLYGMGNQTGEDRPVEGTQLFVSSGDRVRVVPVTTSNVFDVVWMPTQDLLLAACAEGLLRADPSTQKVEWRWKPERGRVTRADHGRSGEIVMVLEREGSPGTEHPIYVYDASGDVGVLHENDKDVGYPVLTPTTPAKAWMTVGEDLWELGWTGDTKVAVVTRHEGESRERWLTGLSGAQRWFSDSTHWYCGATRVPFAEVSSWVIGPAGFYACRSDKTWLLVRPEGGDGKGGRLDPNSLIGFRVQGDVPWVALQSGDLRPIDSPSAGFRVLLPK